MRYLLTIIFVLISPILFAMNTTQTADSLLHLLKDSHSPEQKIQLYRNLADLYLDHPEYKTYLLKMYDEASKIDNKEIMVEALDGILVEAANTNQKDTLIKYVDYLKQVATQEELNYLLPIYEIRLFDAQCFTNQKNEALKNELNLLDSVKDEKNIYDEIASTFILGVSFYTNDKFVEAIPYLEKALKLTETITGKEKVIYWKRILWKLSYAYVQSGREKEAIQLMKSLISQLEDEYKTDYQDKRPFYKIDLYRLQYYSFMISCLPFLTLEEENYYWKQIQLIGKNLTNILDKYNYYLCANNYYSVNHTKKDYPKAIAANDSLIKFAKILAPQNLPGLYDINSRLYEAAQDYPNALNCLRISYQMQDSLNTDIAHKQLNELQVKYDVKKLNIEKAQLEIKNKKMLIISLIILLIIVIGVCSHLYFSLKREKRMKAELKVLNRKAQESEKMKQAFINSICHEIRTPLNSIVGFSDLIMNTDIDEETRREFPAEIQKSTQLLTGLVNSMLEVASLDVSEDRLPCEDIDIRNICIQEMERITHKKEIEYQLDITEDTLLIPTNAQYLTLVIEHLLNNANKFTEKGKITLGYNVNKTQDKIFINVTDTGCGIPQEKYEEVFNRFSKLDSFIPGNGLGLYLCRLIVKRLGGEIKIDPDYTNGTRMTVSLPIK